ncbi:MAG: ribosome maturation factor RimM [Pseudomonadota bacterium]
MLLADPTGLVELGHVTGAYGLRGWIKVHSDTQPRSHITTYSRLLLRLSDQWQPWQVACGREQGKYITLKLQNCDDCDRAEQLIGARIAVTRADLPGLTEPGEYYWADLIGLTVQNLQATTLGTVQNLLATGAQDVLVLSGTRERLIPFVWQKTVHQVDLENGSLLVDWDEDF